MKSIETDSQTTSHDKCWLKHEDSTYNHEMKYRNNYYTQKKKNPLSWDCNCINNTCV